MDETRLPLTEHLRELRNRLVYCFAAVVCGFIVAYIFHTELFTFLKQPIIEVLRKAKVNDKIQQLGFLDLFLVHIKLSIVVSLFAVSPFILYQAWAFIAPGLYKTEKKFLMPFIFTGTTAFLLGAAFCYIVVLPLVGEFFVSLALDDPTVDINLTVQTVYSFPISLIFAFGIIFELPLIQMFLGLFGFLDWKRQIRLFKYFVILSFILGALFTPPDPTSQVLVAVPMNILYWLGVLLAFIVGKRRAANEKANTDGGISKHVPKK